MLQHSQLKHPSSNISGSRSRKVLPGESSPESPPRRVPPGESPGESSPEIRLIFAPLVRPRYRRSPTNSVGIEHQHRKKVANNVGIECRDCRNVANSIKLIARIAEVGACAVRRRAGPQRFSAPRSRRGRLVGTPRGPA